jgi:hypothetical protein
MRFLPPEEQAIVDQAQVLGLAGANPPPAYLSPGLCSTLSLALALPTLGFSLLLVPVVWVAQHDHTAQRLTRLRRELEEDVRHPGAEGRPNQPEQSPGAGYRTRAC